jgi:hypothetical protein
MPVRSGFDVVNSFDLRDRAVLPSGGIAVQTFTTQARGRALRYHVDLELEFRNGRYEVTALIARRKKGGPEVTGEGLRQLPVKAIVREATRKLPPAAFVLAISRPSRDLFRRVNDEALGIVSVVYRAALEEAKPPTQTLADYLGMPRSTAARWIARARERGFLGPATPGKAGEQPRKKG